jgi:hypothetical protein
MHRVRFGCELRHFRVASGQRALLDSYEVTTSMNAA